jgi:sulfur-carrier protein adenylyltransferase/sulfurtransferase
MKPTNGHLSKEELVRYNRHIIIPEFGLEAQQKLKTAKVLVIGAGGLGSPLLLYLAAAGVGTLGIIDNDVVEDSNLQRQVLFGIKEIGLRKVEAAKQKLQQLNPYITINIHNLQLTAKNAMELINAYDVVADGTDNFPTRYLINDACVLLNKPSVFASVFQFEGQLTVFNAVNHKGERGPNYRDLFPSPPPPALVPSCAEAGVLGVLPGIIGSMQALEVIKVITGVGEILNGRLYTFDALTFESRILNFKRSTSNAVNGENPTIHSLIDYEKFCDVHTNTRNVKEISIAEFLQWQEQGEAFQLIDVREPTEFNAIHMGGQLLPLATLVEQAGHISRDKKVVVHCKSGKRSAIAIQLLEDTFGFENLYNLKGGLVEYIHQVEAYHLNNTKYKLA